jgi:hypothetical protein
VLLPSDLAGTKLSKNVASRAFFANACVHAAARALLRPRPVSADELRRTSRTMPLNDRFPNLGSVPTESAVVSGRSTKPSIKNRQSE